MQAIEIAAGAQYGDVGLHEIAVHDPFGLDELAEYIRAGRCWVLEADGDVDGYAVVDLVGEYAHLEQVSVVPERQGRGFGRALVEHVVTWARVQGYPGVTLTTFRTVAWNAPLYAHLGFRVLDDDELTDALRDQVAIEAAHGLDPNERVVMLRAIGE